MTRRRVAHLRFEEGPCAAAPKSTTFGPVIPEQQLRCTNSTYGGGGPTVGPCRLNL
jgi:hypothetical protein